MLLGRNVRNSHRHHSWPYWCRGGILAIPALVIGLGWTLTQSTPVALFAVSAAAAVGAIYGLRKGLVRYRAALLMALLGAVFSPLGVYLAHSLPNAVLISLFSRVMVIVAIRMARQACGNQANTQVMNSPGNTKTACSTRRPADCVGP